MSENFCLQPYHIGERLLACFLNMSTDIVKEKFNIENFAEAIPEQSFSFERTDIRTDDQHKIDIVLKANDKFYAVELKLGPHNTDMVANRTIAQRLFPGFFKEKNQCYIQQSKNGSNYLKGNMCCLLSNLWKDKSQEWFINKKGDVYPNWFLIVRDNSVKKLLEESKSKYLLAGLQNCTVLSLEHIVKNNNAKFMDCIRECVVLPTVDDYLSKWGLAKMEK